MTFPKYLTIQKKVGETPLEALLRLRAEEGIPKTIPLAYAGRLDPMASGTLIVLIGDECKVQERYHAYDKEYVCEVLMGVGSDTHDVLGISTQNSESHPTRTEVTKLFHELTGSITLPYPHFSSKTVNGKPLHTWALEGKLDTITIPEKTSTVYALTCTNTTTISKDELHTLVRNKIALLPTVTDERKALGRDFRRTDVLASWETVFAHPTPTVYTIITLRGIVSSGTYMRTLAHTIGTRLGSDALALSIHRARIGTYQKIPLIGGFFRHTL